MRNNILTIMKKECSRLFGDKKLFLTAVILPGLLIFVMYNLMGNLMANINSVEKDYVYQIYAVNMPDSISGIISAGDLNVNVINTSEADAESVKQRITDKEADILIKFPVGFDALVEAYDVSSETSAPNVQIWSNMARTESAEANDIITSVLNEYEYSMANKFDINAVSAENPDEQYQLASEADIFMTYFVYMLPMMLIMFIFVGCQAIAPESIAGEKERGTLGTLLVTPAKRSDIALAKIFSITIFGLLGAAGSFLGLMLSLPKMMQTDSVSIDYYSIADYAMIFIISVSTVLVFVSILSILSAYSKSIKEATTYSMPFMILSILFGLSSMLTGGVPKEIYYYLIPVFNSAQCLTAIFKLEASALNIAVTTGTNIVFMLLCTFALTRMFNSEKIVFDK